MGWTPEELCFNSLQGQTIFLFYKAFRPAQGTIWPPI